MKNIGVIALKELRTYFASPLAYVVMAVFLAITGFFFTSSLSGGFPEATIRGYLFPGVFVLILLAPLLTMRLFAEEQKLGTIELLLTNPVRDEEVVLGKYLASLGIWAAMLALTFYYPILLFWFGDPDAYPIATGYLGFFLLGATAIAVGLLASSLTSNQIVAAVLALGVLLFLYLMDNVAGLFAGLLSQVLEYLSLSAHMRDLSWGVIDTRDIIYYVSLTVLFLFLTFRSLEMRRWR